MNCETFCPVCGARNRTLSEFTINNGSRFSLLGWGLKPDVKYEGENICHMCHSKYTFETDIDLFQE